MRERYTEFGLYLIIPVLYFKTPGAIFPDEEKATMQHYIMGELYYEETIINLVIDNYTNPLHSHSGQGIEYLHKELLCRLVTHTKTC